MSNAVYAVKEESNRSRLVKEPVGTTVTKPTGYLRQRLENNVFRETDVSLNQDLKNFFLNKTNLKLLGIYIYHNSPSLAKSLQAAKYKEAAGFTLVVFKFENHPSLFSYSLCKLGENFSRLEGRVYAKRRALSSLNKSLPKPVFDIVGNVKEYTGQLPNYGLLSYPDHPKNIEKNPNSVTPTKIANWFIKNFIKTPVEKLPKPINPLSVYNEEVLLLAAKQHLAKTHDIEVDSVKLYTQYIRKYSNKMFNGLLATPEWFKSLDDQHKELISNGGYTVYGIIGTNAKTKTRQIFVTISRCSDEESFEKALGRKQCLTNIVKNKFLVFNYTKEVDNVCDSLISLFMQQHKVAVNCERGAPQVQELSTLTQ